MKIQLINSSATAPSRATEGAAAYDCCAFGNYNIAPSGGKLKISLGFKIEVPPGSAALLLPRSGLGSKGIVLANGTGVIDSDYRGEVFAVIQNNSCDPFVVVQGDRICQMLITLVQTPEIELVSELSETVRGTGGFGSTGVSQ